ncbi:MAG: metal ABC transporter ATP-binding protein [Bacteroidetes bacterium]|nr:MAG: metal ABC transporter ATP-binding protein [Bacteroidota bacterium]MBL1145276.1 metal ABC transporter ATP-binding protein [Bacteroidota bacterium]MCB0803850.1 metal ABC transporter ATP-binding protein [Flavobacteriales bacterium]NOG58072.1 metal ABC transporter ATP-binding protein [Bacteroidota bacterium]
MEVALETHNLTVSYNRRPVLWNIDFKIPVGQITGIIGPNGSGKTTLLKAIMGLVKPSSGYCKLFDQDLKQVRERISYVPQRESVDWDFPASVMDIVLMGRYKSSNLFKRINQSDRDIAVEALEKVNMLEFSNRQISQLSGGQQQRVFIARSLAQGADLYIMDEPFVGVDAATEEAILNLLTEMKNQGKTVIVVHHDLQTAKDYFDWIVLLNTRLVAVGPKDDIFREDLLQEAYGGKLNVLSKVGDLIKEKGFSVRERK